MPLAMCKACQNIYMVIPEMREFCPVCGGSPLILEEEAKDSPAEEAPEEPTPAEEIPVEKEEE